jgi:hydrogenase maturation protein HypF
MARSVAPRRLRLRVRGAVQGVGFRPFVHGLAHRYRLGGFVVNDAEGVLIEIEGERVEEFISALETERPPLASIVAIEAERTPSRGESTFTIERSRGGRVTTSIPADAATCEACVAELFDPASRFYLYPFINCTHCGPRFTIARKLPYDRARTAMADFVPCEDCARDYRDPGNRRFHAEAIACPRCGPRLSHAVADVVAAIRAGRVVALKGIGGFHLVCDATNEEAVATLRRRKDRDAKPFAVMVASPAALDRVAIATEAERALLVSSERPIVLVRDRGALAPSVAPGLAHIGVMLPYAPLHHLLFHAARGAEADELVLVATSANPGGEPLVIDDDDARRRLAGIADVAVTHDRPIVIRADDSVMAIVAGAPAFVRRARGYVPRPIRLSREVPPVLAVGGHLKSTVTVTRGREALVSQHIGDLDTAESIRFFEETIDHLRAIADVTPMAVAHDLHRDFASTRFAEMLGLPLVPVQHHHAHVAALMAEHGIEEATLGVVLDGYGLGDDGGAWGGELLLCEGASFTRLGHLAPLALPGGDRAAREPWRMAAAALHALGRDTEIAHRFAGEPHAAALAALLARDGVPTTTSAGRLFDAVAGLLGTRQAQDYEGQAAMELESRVRAPRVAPKTWSIDAANMLDLAPLLERLAEPGCDATFGAELFHGTFAAALAEWVAATAARHGARHVALGGGCFLNRVLTDALVADLRARGLSPLVARRVPPNDGGLSLGQAWIAAQVVAADGPRSIGGR